MKVLLIGNYAPDRQESMSRFAGLLERELRASGHRVELLCPRARLNRAGAPPVGAAKWLGYLDKFLLFPMVLRRAARRADLVHICDHSNAPYVRFLGGAPHLVTCHDVLAIRSALGLTADHSTGKTGTLLQKWITRGLNRAACVVCDSENTRQQLLEVSSLKREQLEMVFVGLNYPYSPVAPEEAAVKVRELIPHWKNRELPRYILHVGGDQWYKNREGVLRIYRELSRQMGDETPCLIMAGRPFTASMQQFVEDSKLVNIISVPNVSNEELRALYCGAQLFVFPSLAEGFGWPVIEAQACGTRVLTSDFRPLTEVGGDAAFYADPHDEAGFARAIAALLKQSEAEKRASREAGFENVARFDPQIMTEAYLRIYRTLLERAKQ